MGKEKSVEAITDMEKDFAQWYTDVVKKADLADYSSVGGFIIYRPYGYAIWELIQAELNRKFKETGHENVYMPLVIPESLLQKEKDHVQGFAPEVAWVTEGGGEKLTEKFCIRPTSETLFCEHFSKIVQSHRDLPKLYNQWCSVVRWEKTTRPFLRGREFLWQEGHTVHATEAEAREETLKILDIYADLCEQFLAIPCIKGRKTDKEKFAGAVETYSFESLMHDGKALQAGTTHYFGDGFARAFNILFTDKDNLQRYPHGTSWGISTRLIGGIIMVHGDNSGLVLPPAVAPIQVVIVPIASHKPGVIEKAEEIAAKLKQHFRVKIDSSDKSAGWKFAEYEMKGVPIRLELGPKDIAEGKCVLARRDKNSEKITANIENVEKEIETLLADIQKNMFEKARAIKESKTFTAKNVDEMNRILNETPGIIKGMWCGSRACEEEIKDKALATSRNIPFEQEKVSDVCVCCGKPAETMVYWARAY